VVVVNLAGNPKSPIPSWLVTPCLTGRWVEELLKGIKIVMATALMMGSTEDDGAKDEG
jgi:hypothetical protein